MKPKNILTDEQIGERIKAGKNFIVATPAERRAVLVAARFIGVDVRTREVCNGFKVQFLKVSE